MAVGFENLTIQEIILHKVFAPNGDTPVPPDTSDNLIELEQKALDKLKERVIDAISKESKCMEMELADSGEDSYFKIACNLLESDSDKFIEVSKLIAEKHTKIHTNRAWPGGILVVLKCTISANSYPCIIVIKAESHEGFVEEDDKGKMVMKLLDNLFLTPQTKLYKVGVFVLAGKATDNHNADKFETHVFDATMVKSQETMAKYFYASFLGLRIPESSERTTRDFYEAATTFIDESSIVQSEKIELKNALTVYIKVEKSSTMSVNEFSNKYLEAEMKKPFKDYMQEKGVPDGNFAKNTTLIKGKLRVRKIKFSHGISLSGSSEDIKERVTIGNFENGVTNMEIKGKVVGQP